MVGGYLNANSEIVTTYFRAFVDLERVRNGLQFNELLGELGKILRIHLTHQRRET